MYLLMAPMVSAEQFTVVQMGICLQRMNHFSDFKVCSSSFIFRCLVMICPCVDSLGLSYLEFLSFLKTKFGGVLAIFLQTFSDPHSFSCFCNSDTNIRSFVVDPQISEALFFNSVYFLSVGQME